MNCFAILSVALLATLLFSCEYVAAREICPQENCVTDDKCDNLQVGGSCSEQGTTCCSVLKKEYRDHCRHHGGECMSSCAPQLQQNVVDCPSNTVCCVLV